METLAPLQKQLKHKTLERELRQLVQTVPIGAKFPSERDLAVKYECNFLTVRKALKTLVADGLIDRRPGSGTFVSRRAHGPGVGEGLNGALNGSATSIGVLVFPGGDRYSFAVLQALAHAALDQDIALRSRWVRDFAQDGLEQAHALREEGCCALTLPWFAPSMAAVVHDFVRKSPLPISLPMVIPGLEKYSFEAPDIYGVSIPLVIDALCQFFQRQGRRHIAFLGPDTPNDPVLQQKLSAYALFTSRNHLPSICGVAGPGSRAMDEVARRWEPYWGDLAIVSYDDEHALRFMTSMHKLGLSAPKDFVIVGYNDSEASHYSDPPLTTVRQNYDYVAQWLIKTALGLAKGNVVQSQGAPELDLLVRDTCGSRTLSATKPSPELDLPLQYLRIIRRAGL